MSEQLRNLANLWRGGSEREASYADDIFDLLDQRDALRAENTALQGQVAGVVTAMTDARDSLRFVRTWSKHIDVHGVLIKEDFWAWAEGWDCDLEPQINAALNPDTVLTLNSRVRELETALTTAAEKVGWLYDKYRSEEAFWNDEGAAIIVDATWESRLVEADAVLSRALTPAPAPAPERGEEG